MDWREVPWSSVVLVLAFFAIWISWPLWVVDFLAASFGEPPSGSLLSVAGLRAASWMTVGMMTPFFALALIGELCADYRDRKDKKILRELGCC